ncbi:hypothetical protein B7P43_G09738, partial [Cryptotermes secundus]
VLQAVLRANQGAVDATIDQLLAMTTDNENEKLRNEMEQKETLSVISPVGARTEAKSQETSPARTVRGWAPPLLGPLPDDFLRLAPAPWVVSQKKQVKLDRYLEDERIALFLQNEEFMAELRWNKDFLLTLEKGGTLVKYILQYISSLCLYDQAEKAGEREREENGGSGE